VDGVFHERLVSGRLWDERDGSGDDSVYRSGEYRDGRSGRERDHRGRGHGLDGDEYCGASGRSGHDTASTSTTPSAAASPAASPAASSGQLRGLGVDV
jgi:hypothetical protein